MMYFNNLTALWDEMGMLLSPLDCVCLAKGKSNDREEQLKLVKFLIGLNDTVYSNSDSAYGALA